MIKAGIGLSCSPHTATAANQAARAAMAQLGSVAADAVLLFATHHHCAQYPALFQVMCTVCGTENVVGCSGHGVLTIHQEIEGGPGVVALAVASDEVSLQPFLMDQKLTDERTVEQTMLRVFKDSRGGGGLLVLFPDLFSLHLGDFIRSVEKVAGGVPIVGAAPAGEAKARETFQWCGPQLSRRGVSGFLMSGAFTPRIGVTEGCQPIGEPFIITKASGNIVYEIGRLPAVKVLRDTLESLSREDQELARHSVFVGIVIDEEREEFGRGDFLVRNIVSADPKTGALAIGDTVRPGQTIQFNIRDPDAAVDDLREMVAHLAQEMDEEPVRLGLYFNCLARGMSLYRRPNVDTSILREFLGTAPLIGLNGNAEIAPVRHRTLVHNYTGALVVI